MSITEYLQKSKEENEDVAKQAVPPDSASQYRNGKKKRNESRRSTTIRMHVLPAVAKAHSWGTYAM